MKGDGKAYAIALAVIAAPFIAIGFAGDQILKWAPVLAAYFAAFSAFAAWRSSQANQQAINRLYSSKLELDKIDSDYTDILEIEPKRPMKWNGKAPNPQFRLINVGPSAAISPSIHFEIDDYTPDFHLATGLSELRYKNMDRWIQVRKTNEVFQSWWAGEDWNATTTYLTPRTLSRRLNLISGNDKFEEISVPLDLWKISVIFYLYCHTVRNSPKDANGTLMAPGLRKPTLSVWFDWKDLLGDMHTSQRRKFQISLRDYELWLPENQANPGPLVYEQEGTYGALPDWEKIRMVLHLSEID